MAPRERLWQRPRLRTDEEFERHRAVTWLELYFDLVFVVVIARLAHGLAGGVDGHGLLAFLLMFVAVWWIWNAMTYYIERFESEGLEARLFTFLTMIPVAGLALHVHHGLGANYAGFALSYLLARAVNMGMWIRAGFHEPRFRPVALRFALGFALAAALIGLSLYLPETWWIPLFGLAVLIDILTPNFTVRHQAALPRLSTSKFPERMGLVTIVVLGEVISGVIAGLSDGGYHLDLSGTFNGVLGLWIGFSLWWVYFDYVARRPPRPVFIVALTWNYLHLAVNIAITLAGVGIGLILRQAETLGHPDLAAQVPLLTAVGVTLILVALLEPTLQPAPNEPFHPWLSPALKGGAGLALILLAAGLPAFEPRLVLLIAVALLLPQQVYGALIWLHTEAREP